MSLWEILFYSAKSEISNFRIRSPPPPRVIMSIGGAPPQFEKRWPTCIHTTHMKLISDYLDGVHTRNCPSIRVILAILSRRAVYRMYAVGNLCPGRRRTCPVRIDSPVLQ
ncbi:hypothetical protein TNCV_4419691 [Trichonephila clavipes]|nr:hypothetical protein TNCV_4419691 [Trichonephila clavipes]